MIFAVASTEPQHDLNDKNIYTNYYWFEFNNNVLIPLFATDPTYTSDPYDCPGIGNYIGTRAYIPTDTETYMDGSVQKRRPKSTSIAQIQINKPTP